jgi:2-succinyl-5-enolpyruvyl-6-hydroxy-3-cyclohexene-1-carboxylate synthase
MPATAAATFCATLVDEWVRGGLTDAVVAPGSRSTPLALALAGHPAVRVHMHLDERSAAFVALGLGVATGRPAIVLCTSGTAAANLHPAVVEAHQGEVPLVVCTADRPPELRDTGAPQTIDQWGLFTTSVRWFHDPGVPDDSAAASWRGLAARALLDATGPRPGPVHLNLPFREPLVGEPGPLPAPRADRWHRLLAGPPSLRPGQLDDLAAVLDGPRGVIVAGRGAGDPEAVHALADAAGWPVLADPVSGCRLPRPATVAAFDDLLRHDGFARDHTPQVVLRLGAAPASKVLAQWLAGSGAVQVQVHPTAAWLDADRTAALRVVADPAAACRALAGRVAGGRGTPWAARWARAEAAAQDAIDRALASHPEATEPSVARATLHALPAGATFVVSSSMPVRDVEWYGRPRDGVRVVANRGANGIDGVTSTAVGVAMAGGVTALLIGDVAFLHDANGLLGAAGRGIDLAIVCIDNGGGGIFSFLPQASMVEPDRFEQLFGTPHGVDVAAVAAAHDVACDEVVAAPDVAEAVAAAVDAGGVRLVRVRTDRAANVAVHAELHAAVTATLDRRA